jgi:integrase
MQVRLTTGLVNRVVRRVPPGDRKPADYFDVDLPGFFLRAWPQRRPGRPWACTYYIRWKDRAGRERRVSIGDARTVSLEEAWARAKQELARIALGANPLDEKQAARAALTIGAVCERYLASPEFTRHSPKSRTVYVGLIRNHLLRHLKNVLASEVGVLEARRLQRGVESDTRIGRRRRKMGGSGVAKKAVRQLSAVLTWATHEGLIKSNPLLHALRLKPDGQRTTVIVDADSYGRLFGTMDAMVAAGTLKPIERACVVLIACTGMRKGEALHLRWRDVSLAEARITLHDSKGVKLGRSGIRQELVHLPPLALATLAAIRPENGDPDALCFPPARGAVLAIHRTWAAIRTQAQLPATLGLHGLRHSIATNAILSGLSTLETQRLMRHSSPGVTSKYVHIAQAHEATLAARALANVLPATDSPADVVPLKRGGR